MKNSAQKDSRCNAQKLEHDFSKSTHHTEFPITMTGKNLSATAPWRKIFINSPRNQQRMIPSTSTVIFSLVPFLNRNCCMLGRSPRGVHPQLRSLEVFQDEAPRLLHEAKKLMSHFDNISVRWTTQLPQNLTWNLKITHQKRKRSQSVFLGFHVSFRGGGGVHYLGKVKLP